MHSKLYVSLMNSRQWRRLRTVYLASHPLCERCEMFGYDVAARCVHHKIPVESGKTPEECKRLAFQWANLQALCYKCHADLHTIEGARSKQGHKDAAEARLEQWKERIKQPKKRRT